MQRLLADAPLEIRLRAERRVTLTLLDSERRPLANARVEAAAQDNARLPWRVHRQPITTVTGFERQSHAREFINGKSGCRFRCSPNDWTATRSRYDCQRREPHCSRLTNACARRQDRITWTAQTIPGLAETKLFVVSVPLEKYRYVGAPTSGTPLECGWAFVPVASDGSFEIPHLQLGDLLHRISCAPSFAYREAHRSERPSLRAGDGPMQWTIEFQRQPELFVTILDSQTGAPLPNIHIANFDGRLERTVTDEEGKASFFRVTVRSSYHPSDATGQFFCADAFFQYAKTPPVNNEVHFKPLRMIRSSGWKGRVVDQDGKPVAGAKVAYEYGLERFNMTGFAYSNRDGTFRLTNIADGTAIKIRASTERNASEAKSLVLPDSDGLELHLKEQPTASPVGQLVDPEGRPVVGVSVAIKRASVMQKEKFGREELTPVDLYSPPQVTRSDAKGRFRFPITQGFGQRLRIEVQDPRYFQMVSPYIDASQISRMEVDSGTPGIDLGQFTIMRRPGTRKVQLTVASNSGESIKGADLVFVGARTGKVRGRTGDMGQVELDLVEGPCVFAVRADGYHVHFGRFDARGADEHRVSLRPTSESAAPPEQDSVSGIAEQQFLDAARQLFADMEVPDLESVTFHRLRLYLDALAALSPDQFAAYVRTNAAYASMGQAAAMAGDRALKQKPELIELAAESGLVSGPYLSSFYLTAANATHDEELRADWLGEALVSSNQPHEKARCVLAMLAAEEVDLAKSIATELWDNSAALRKMVETQTREQKIGGRPDDWPGDCDYRSRRVTATDQADSRRSRNRGAANASDSELGTPSSQQIERPPRW